MPEYTIRWYRPADRAQFLDLYADALDTWSHSPDWFDWKYVSNPYVDHVPIVVAEADGDLVGARTFFALPMVVAGERRRALQPSDTILHPDHRRRELLTRMTQLAIDRYEEREPVCFFSFPSELTRRGTLQLGWERAGTVPLAYRVENLTPMVATRTSGTGRRLAGEVGTRLLDRYTRVRERPTEVPTELSLSHETTVPIEELAAIYEGAVPEAIHAVRDPAFYRWRLANPRWNYSAVLVERADERVGAVVGRYPPGKIYGPEVTRLVDVVPLSSSDQRDSLVRALLEYVRATFPTTDLFVAPTTIASDVLRDQGFHEETEPPLSYLRTARPHLVRALGSSPAGQSLTDGEHWTTTLLETDTG